MQHGVHLLHQRVVLQARFSDKALRRWVDGCRPDGRGGAAARPPRPMQGGDGMTLQVPAWPQAAIVERVVPALRDTALTLLPLL
jgi:hypothetical protein